MGGAKYAPHNDDKIKYFKRDNLKSLLEESLCLIFLNFCLHFKFSALVAKDYELIMPKAAQIFR